jgi:hypothetical protein
MPTLGMPAYGRQVLIGLDLRTPITGRESELEFGKTFFIKGVFKVDGKAGRKFRFSFSTEDRSPLAPDFLFTLLP